MATFKDHIIKCIETNSDILVKDKHLQSVTFTDICVLIHLITTRDKSVELTGDAAYSHNYHISTFGKSRITITQNINNEELLILFSICKLPLSAETYVVQTVNDEVYHMSPKFIEAARYCGVYNYLLSRYIIAAFDIEYEYNTDEAEAHLKHYMGHNKKSARNI